MEVVSKQKQIAVIRNIKTNDLIMYQKFGGLIFCILLLFITQIVSGQSQTLSIKEVLQKVQTNLPQLEALWQQTIATEQNIALAKNTIVPDLNAGYQVNMATFNNITGMSYPGFLLPISGPPSISNKMNLIPGSALGALVI